MTIYNLIIKNFKEGDKIPLLTSNLSDVYLGTSPTKVNGQLHENAILFKISETIKKRITSEFIELTYQYFEENNKSFPNREWYKTHEKLSYEYNSRPCNYSVVQGLIMEAIKKK